mgnify:CR=1 FL=1
MESPEPAWLRGFLKLAPRLTPETKTSVCRLLGRTIDDIIDELDEALAGKRLYDADKLLDEAFELDRLRKRIC